MWNGFLKLLELQDIDSLKPEFYGRALASRFITSWSGISAAATEQDGKQDSEAVSESAIRGDIQFEAVTVSYSADLEPAVKELSFNLVAGQRLGLVGRSGSDKSTTLLALFCMIEMLNRSILIDGQDITSIPVRKLRSQMRIGPQNALILAATIRENLDPEDI